MWRPSSLQVSVHVYTVSLVQIYDQDQGICSLGKNSLSTWELPRLSQAANETQDPTLSDHIQQERPTRMANLEELEAFITECELRLKCEYVRPGVAQQAQAPSKASRRTRYLFPMSLHAVGIHPPNEVAEFVQIQSSLTGRDDSIFKSSGEYLQRHVAPVRGLTAHSLPQIEGEQLARGSEEIGHYKQPRKEGVTTDDNGPPTIFRIEKKVLDQLLWTPSMPVHAAMKWAMWTVSRTRCCGCRLRNGCKLPRKRNAILFTGFDSKTSPN